MCGGRNNARSQVRAVLNAYKKRYPEIEVVIHGNGGNTDHEADAWARENNLEIEKYGAEWGTYGRAAGPIRNNQMIIAGKPDMILAIAGGRGTADTVRRARKIGLPVEEVEL